MTNRSYSDFISVARFLGADVFKGECFEERVARLFLALAEEIQAIKEPTGRDFWTERGQLPPEERSQRGKDGTWIDPPVLERARDTGPQGDLGVPTSSIERSGEAAVPIEQQDPPVENCGCCRFFGSDTNGEGVCRWRPTYVLRNSSDWCGRFLRKPAVLL